MTTNEEKSNQPVDSTDELSLNNTKRCAQFPEENTKVSLSKSSDSEIKPKSLPERIPAFGLIVAIVSTFFFSFQSVIVSVLTELHSIEILVIRSILQFIFYLIMALVKRNPIFGESDQRIYLVLRAVTGTVSITTIYSAYRLMPIADASTIHFASPVFVAIFGYFLLKEKMSIVEIVMGLITLVGVVIIARPEFIFGSESEVTHDRRLEGTILAIVASVTGAFVQITLRKLKKTPVDVICIWFSFIIVVSGIVILVIMDELVWPTGWKTWALLFANGVCCIGDQFFFTIAFKYENAGPVSMVRTFNIALVFVWEVLILSETVEWTSVGGACLVFSCIVIISVLKWKTENPSQYESAVNKILCRKHQSNNDIEKPSIETFSQNVY